MCGVAMAELPPHHTCPADVVSEAISTNQPNTKAEARFLWWAWEDGFKAGKEEVGKIAAGKITGDADFDDLFNRCREVLKTKGADYSGSKPHSPRSSQLSNFYLASSLGMKLSPFHVWWIYFFKHLSAIITFIREGQVESEPIKERIVDAINYLALLHKMILHESEKP